MTALLRAELARVRARPLVHGMLVLVVLGTLGLVLSAWWSTRPPSPEQVQVAQVELAAAERVWRVEGEGVLARCVELEAEARADAGPDVDFMCDEMAPHLGAFLPYRPDLGTILPEKLPTVGLMAVIAMAMTAAGLVTAEFRSGAIATWLTFAPRRGRVFLSKLAAACSAALVLAAVPAAVAVVGLVAVCAANGVVTVVDGTVVAGLVGGAARWLAVGLGAVAVAHGLAFALRNAAAVTGVVVWWVATVESALPLVLPAAGWLRASTNVEAVVTGHAWYEVPVCVADATASAGRRCEDVVHVVGAGQGALVLGGLVLVVVLAGWLSFRLRDVT